jgi:hypothetical protein
MSGIIQGLLAVLRSGVAITDSFFNRVTLLLNTINTNGSQNKTFLDDSTANSGVGWSITTNGSATQGTFTPFSQTGWSGNFNTTTTYLTVTDTANLRFGSSNFTIEAWVYRNATGAIQTIASKGASTPTGWVFQISAADKLVFTDTSTSITGATSLAANTWYYVAVVRAGTGASQTTLYLNATSDATGTSATNFSQTTNMLIGADRSTTNFANGYISNLRLSNTNRTISSTPTTALIADANTIFLGLNSNWFQYTDSTAAYTSMAPTGTPLVQAFSPFAPVAAYSTNLIGGSGYFNGSADGLTISGATANNLGSGDFTFETWLYLNNVNTLQTILSYGVSGALFRCFANNATIWLLSGATSITSSSGPSVLTTGQWLHLAITRSGTATGNVKVYINGVNVITNSGANTTNFTGGNLYVGLENGSGPFSGYMSGYRIIKGQALTSGNFTPPTSPVNISAVGWTGANVASSISGTVILLPAFTNSGIYDATAKNDVITVDTVQVSTAQAKFGSASMAFDGTGDWLLLPDSINQQLGTGDFTIEGFIYLNAIGVAYGIISKGTASTGWSVNVTSGNKLQFSYTASNLTGTTSLAASTWYYFAVVRSGTATGNLKLYLGTTGTASVDATSAGAVNDSFTQTDSLYVGASRTGTTSLNGYLDEIRITKGVARTVTTIPTATFPIQ